MNKTLLKLSGAFAAIAAVGLPIVHALAAKPLPLPGVVDNINSGESVLDSICVVLNYLFTAAIILSIALILIAAFRYITASGDPEKLKSAHKTLMYVAIGIAVAILARTIPVIVASFLGLEAGDVSPCGGTSSGSEGKA
jgi:hypothetical protein